MIKNSNGQKHTPETTFDFSLLRSKTDPSEEFAMFSLEQQSSLLESAHLTYSLLGPRVSLDKDEDPQVACWNASKKEQEDKGKTEPTRQKKSYRPYLQRYKANLSPNRLLANRAENQRAKNNTTTFHLDHSPVACKQRITCAINRIAPRLKETKIGMQLSRERNRPFLPANFKVNLYHNSNRRPSVDETFKLSIPTIHAEDAKKKAHTKSISIRFKSLNISEILRKQRRREKSQEGLKTQYKKQDEKRNTRLNRQSLFRITELPLEKEEKKANRAIHTWKKKSNLLQKKTEELEQGLKIRQIEEFQYLQKLLSLEK